MDLDEARDVLRRQHRAVLATWRSDGTPQLSPVTVGVDEEGYAVISSRTTAYKVRNLRRDPRAYLCVFPDTFFGGRWVQVDGTVTVVDLPEAMEPLVSTTGASPGSIRTGPTTGRRWNATSGYSSGWRSPEPGPTGRGETGE